MPFRLHLRGGRGSPGRAGAQRDALACWLLSRLGSLGRTGMTPTLVLPLRCLCVFAWVFWESPGGGYLPSSQQQGKFKTFLQLLTLGAVLVRTLVGLGWNKMGKELWVPNNPSPFSEGYI